MSENLRRCLDATEALLRRFVHFRTEAELVAVVLWTVHTYTWEHFPQSPILAVTSAVMRSGKTRLLDVLELVVWRPWRVILPSDAVVYRYIDERHPTLMLDEADAIFGRKNGEYEGLRALLNAGNRMGTTVPRLIGQGSTFKMIEFSIACPKVIAGIGRFPATVADRTVPVRMERRSRSESVERFRRADVDEDAAGLRADLEYVAANVAFSEFPAVPDELDDRAAESWEPLLAVASLAGPEWLARARRSAVLLHATRDQDEEAPSLVLLRDIRDIFTEAGEARLLTADLLLALHAKEGSPWGDFYGKPINANKLASMLRPYHIQPREFRIGPKVQRGYALDQFDDAFARYLATATPSATSATTEQERADFTGPVADVAVRQPVAEGGADAEGMLRAALITFGTDPNLITDIPL